MKRILLKFLFIVGGIAMAFLFLELLGHYLNPRITLRHGHIEPGIQGRDVTEYPNLYIKDCDLFWKLDPEEPEINSLGLRDVEFSKEKDKNSVRIICLGDSVTFGWPTDRDKTYPKILEKLLNAHFSKEVFEVYNAGVPGYTTYQGLLWLQKELTSYKPDVIIAYYGLNDRGASYKPDRLQDSLPVWVVYSANHLRNFEFYKLLAKVIFYFKCPSLEYEDYPGVRVPKNEFINNLLMMQDIMERKGGKAIFITNPVYYNPEQGEVFTLHEYVYPKNMLQFDIYELFKTKEQYASELFYDDMRPHNIHLSEIGQKILAQALYQSLISKNVLGGLTHE